MVAGARGVALPALGRVVAGGAIAACVAAIAGVLAATVAGILAAAIVAGVLAATVSVSVRRDCRCSARRGYCCRCCRDCRPSEHHGSCHFGRRGSCRSGRCCRDCRRSGRRDSCHFVRRAAVLALSASGTAILALAAGMGAAATRAMRLRSGMRSASVVSWSEGHGFAYSVQVRIA